MPVLLGDLVHQQIEERRTDPIIVEDVLARIPSRGNVIQRSNEFQSRWKLLKWHTLPTSNKRKY